jgi:hypothetical protein
MGVAALLSAAGTAVAQAPLTASGTGTGVCNVSAGTATSATITINNPSTSTITATGVVATIGVPPAFGFASSTPAGVFSNGTLTVNLGTIAIGGSASVTLNGTAVQGTARGFAVSLSTDQGAVSPAVGTSVAPMVFVQSTTASPIEVLVSSLPSAPLSARHIDASGSYTGGNITNFNSVLGLSLSPDGTRYVAQIPTDNHTVLVTGTTFPFTVSPVVIAGVTQLNLGDTVSSLFSLTAINNAGDYAWCATTTGGTTTTSNRSVIVRGNGATQTVVLRTGSNATAVGAGITYSGSLATFCPIGIRSNGDIAFFSSLAGTGITTANDTAFFDHNGTTLLAREGSATLSNDPGTLNAFGALTFGQWRRANVSGTSGWYLPASVGSDTSRDSVCIRDNAIIVREGDMAPGLAPQTISSLSTVCAGSDWIAVGVTSNSTSWMARNGTLLAKTGDPIYPGAADHWYAPFNPPTGPAMQCLAANSVGDYVVLGFVDNMQGNVNLADFVIVANGHHIVYRRRDPVDINKNGVFDDDAYVNGATASFFGSLTDDGWLYCTMLTSPGSEVCGSASTLSSTLVRMNIHTGACCTSGTCAVGLASACAGNYLGDGSACTAGLCGGGVCCRGATCNASVALGDCTAAAPAGALFVSSANACNSGGSSTTPCCYADFNKTGGITVQDIFDFLNSWFAGSPLTSVGGDGSPMVLSVQNIFDFLNIWFAGGC